MICSQHRRKNLFEREKSSRETIAEGERRKRRERERERIKRERMKRERVQRERMKTWTTWQPHGGLNEKTVHLSGNADVVPQTGHKKRSCHNLDLKGKIVPL